MTDFQPLRTGPSAGGHIQGIALDKSGEYLYCSYTTELIKYHISGRRVGSVRGLTGHLGCLAAAPDGRIAGSLEYKTDAIGRGILQSIGADGADGDGFYAVFFDGEKITRDDMDAFADGIMTAVYLREAAEDYAAEGHRFGCSGIDGITFAPPPGQPEGEICLTVAYGIYGDTARTDNDYQILLSYPYAGLARWEQPLNERNIHKSGPAAPAGKYFIHTGNTTYGVQNLEYEADTGRMYMAVYRGKKAAFPNHTMYAADWNAPAKTEPLIGCDGVIGAVVPLWGTGDFPGWDYPFGSTGMIALGGGKWIFSHDRKEERGFASDILPARFKENLWE